MGEAVHIVDDFVIIVPREEQQVPLPAAPDSDLSPYVGEYLQISKVVQLHEGRSVHGSIYRGRDTTASDELVIKDLITGRFGT